MLQILNWTFRRVDLSATWVTTSWFSRQVVLLVYGHLWPKTLQTQDISVLVPKCPMHNSAQTKKFETLRHHAEVFRRHLAPVPKSLGHFGTTNTFYDEKSDYVNFITFFNGFNNLLLLRDSASRHKKFNCLIYCFDYIGLYSSIFVRVAQ